jgi:hypothetical protein
LIVCHSGTITWMINIMFNVYTIDPWFSEKNKFGKGNCVIGLVYYGKV